MVEISVKSNTKKVKRDVYEALNRGLERASNIWDDGTKMLTPVRTGTLRKGWQSFVNGKDHYIILGNIEKYAPYVELGSPTNKAVHMLRDGILNRKDDIRKAMAAELYSTL